MRRLSVLPVLAAVLLVVPAAPAAAAQLVRVSFSGEIAFGEWSTCRTGQLGERCVFTQVIAGDSRTRETNDDLDPSRRGAYLHDKGPSLVLRHYWLHVQEVDGELTAVPVKESFGGIGVPGFPGDPAVRIDTRLRSASAGATGITMHTTDYVAGTEAWERASVRTAWTGTGPLQRIREGAVQRTTVRTVARQSLTGWSRDVVASGSSSMVADWGAFLGGYLMHVTQTESTAYRGSPAGPRSAVVAQLLTGRPGARLPSTRTTSAYGEAAWTTCPAPQPGDRCRDVRLWYDAEQPGGSRAGLEVDDYDVVEVGDGWVDGRLVVSVTTTATPTTLVAPADLSGARVVVDHAAALRCDGDLDCTPTTVSFTGSWTGTGEAQRFTASAMTWGTGYREWARISGQVRAATATASLADLPAGLGMNGPVDGQPLGASLATSTSRYRLLER